MRIERLQILIITAFGAYIIGASEALPGLLVIPFVAILLWILLIMSSKSK